MKITRVFRALLPSILLFLVSGVAVRADELESLDDPTPAAATKGGAPALDDLSPAPSGGDEEVALDLGGESAFTPYTFSRNPAWAFLPLGALMLVGLHLLRVPKRKSKRKVDQARRFFRDLSGEATHSAILSNPAKPKGEP